MIAPSYDLRPCPREAVIELCEAYHGYGGGGRFAVYSWGVYEGDRIVAAKGDQPPGAVRPGRGRPLALGQAAPCLRRCGDRGDHIRWHTPNPPVETPFDEPTFFEWLATGSSIDFAEPESFDCVAEAAGLSRQDAMIAVTIAWSARLIFPDGTTHIETQTALERLSAAALMSGSL